MIEDRSWGSRLFDILNYTFLAIVALVCLLPLINVFAVSLSDRASTTAHLVKFWPVNFTTLNYEQIVAQAEFQGAFMISLARVGLGSTLTILVTVLTAYPLSLISGFPGQRLFKWLLIFAMLFSGGLIPWFLAIKSLGLLNTIWALILPMAVQVFYIIVMLNFFRNIPVELSEAAIMDGASHWDILFRIYVPLSTPALATILLFVAVLHWNSWFDALILMNSVDKYPLQTYLKTTVITGDFTRLLNDPLLVAKLSEQSLRAAQVFLATVPILIVYPFLQRYFVKGLVLGSVKG